MIAVLGDNSTTLKEVQAVKLQEPTGSRRIGAYWQGVPHGELMDCILRECHDRHWSVGPQKYCLSRDGADLAMAMELKIPQVDIPRGQILGLGVLTSNAMRRALRIVVGSTVVVCQNGMVSGEVVLSRKHTIHFNIQTEIQVALDTYLVKARGLMDTVEGLKARVLTLTDAEGILMHAGRQEIMPWSRIGKVDKEFRRPRFAEFRERTSWSLLNAFTWVVKQNPVLEQMDQINLFRELLPTEQLLAV